MRYCKNIARISLLATVTMLVLCLFGCSVPRHIAERRIERKWQKISNLLDQYPELKSKISVTRKDSVEKPGWADSLALTPPQDTARYDSLLYRYVELMNYLEGRQPCPPEPGTGIAPPPVIRNLSASQRAELERQAQALREQLRAGAYRDTTWRYDNGAFHAEISFIKGKFTAVLVQDPEKFGYEYQDMQVREPEPEWWEHLFRKENILPFLIVALLIFGGLYLFKRRNKE